MGANTKIDWCDSTWNPITGCLHGCEYCYARNIANRFGAGWETASGNLPVLDHPAISTRGKEPYPYNFTPTFLRYKLDEPKKWKRGRNVFVCSVSDLFGKWVPDAWIDEVFQACYDAPRHNYLFLTKNPARYTQYRVPMEANMWYGTSITNNDDGGRFNHLPAFCKTFVSIEPLKDDITDNNNVLFRQVNWVIVGAETGKRKNKVIPKREWIDKIVSACKENSIPVFMKDSLARVLDGELIQEYPPSLNHQRK